MIDGSKKDLNRSWRDLCNILKEDHNDASDNNREEEGILDVCLQLIVKERICLEKENLEV